MQSRNTDPKIHRSKRHGFLYAQVCAWDNLLAAEINAAANGNNRAEVRKFEGDDGSGRNDEVLFANLRQLQSELLTRTYTISPYEVFYKEDPKPRTIHSPAFRDKIVQWAVMQILRPIWTETLTADTYACIRGRSNLTLLDRMSRAMRHDPEGTRFALYIDIRKYYPSIDHDRLKDIVRKKIKDPDLLWLVDLFIDGDDDGIPIGSYISQWFANIYLSALDHRLKERMGVRYYYRYMDDILILSDSKEYLHGLLVFINDFLVGDRALSMKESYQVFPVDSRGPDFAGFVNFRTHRLARKRNKKNLCRQIARLRKRGLDSERIRRIAAPRLGFMKHCNSIHLLNTLGMKKFSEIKPKQGKLTGSKPHIDSIINREIRITGFSVGKSKFDDSGDVLTLQYMIYEQQEDDQGKVIDDEGAPVMGWVKHITFTGSKALMRQLDGIDEITEPVAAKIIKQPIGDGKRCFYALVDPDQ